jgi:AcrR family transcriptional regulator
VLTHSILQSVNLKTHRAGPLAPDDRRRAIIEAVTPLLVERGATVTTREMAEAAGIAEGTIFRVFPDKVALIHDAIKLSMDPEPVCKSLSEITPNIPFEAQLARAAQMMLDYSERVIALVMAIRTMPSREAPRPAGPPPFVAEANKALHHALTKLFERHRDRLRIEPSRAAAVFRGLIFANSHPSMGLAEKLTVEEIVSVLLTGVASPAMEAVT